MSKEIRIPPDWNAEVQINLDRFDFTFNAQTDFDIAERIYQRMLELKGMYVTACNENEEKANAEYTLRFQLDGLILKANDSLTSWSHR
jgi:hypothetical protein